MLIARILLAGAAVASLHELALQHVLNTVATLNMVPDLLWRQLMQDAVAATARAWGQHMTIDAQRALPRGVRLPTRHLCIPRRPGPALQDHGHAPLGNGSRAALAWLKRLTTTSAPGQQRMPYHSATSPVSVACRHHCVSTSTQVHGCKC